RSPHPAVEAWRRRAPLPETVLDVLVDLADACPAATASALLCMISAVVHDHGQAASGPSSRGRRGEGKGTTMRSVVSVPSTSTTGRTTESGPVGVPAATAAPTTLWRARLRVGGPGWSDTERLLLRWTAPTPG